MAVVVAKLDSKGRISLPREIREMVGDVVEMKPVGNNRVLLQRADVRMSKKKNETADFIELNDKEPKRTGKPENPSPNEMKSIWNE